MNTLILIHLKPDTLGTIIFLIGIALRLWIASRRFNRRGVGGLQHYSHFIIGLVITVLEWAGTIIATLLIILGIWMMIPWQNI